MGRIWAVADNTGLPAVVLEDLPHWNTTLEPPGSGHAASITTSMDIEQIQGTISIEKKQIQGTAQREVRR